jgi:hypothetical protein
MAKLAFTHTQMPEYNKEPVRMASICDPSDITYTVQ